MKSKNRRIILENRLTEFQNRRQRLQNVVKKLDDLESELLFSESPNREKIMEIKTKVWKLFLMVESIIGTDARIAFNMWQDQFEDDPIEAVTYPAYIISIFDLPRIEDDELYNKISLYYKSFERLADSLTDTLSLDINTISLFTDKNVSNLAPEDFVEILNITEKRIQFKYLVFYEALFYYESLINDFIVFLDS